MLSWVRDAITFMAFGDKGDTSSDEVRNAFLMRIAGASVDSLHELEAVVTPKLVARVRPESRSLVAMHHEQERDTWIVSASPQPIVEPLAAALGMTGAIGTRGEIADGHYTGKLDGPFVYGAGKAEAIEKLASERGYDLALCYAYSDSISDLPMMRLVGHPVAVNPDSELGAVAAQRGWPVVIFSRRTKRALAFGGLGSGTVAVAVAAYLLGRRHGHSKALASITQRG
jgi:HAD superfamily hydrolase (TIGR01490 family)